MIFYTSIYLAAEAKMAEGKTRTSFVSCIKVKGIHLLPPVITEKRRIELQRYKQQAIKLEKRLRSCRELKKNLEDLLNFQPLISYPQSEITFRDDGHIEALGIAQKGQDAGIPSTNLRKIRLSKDIVDVTQYNNEGIKIIQNGSDTNCTDVNQGHNIDHNDDADASFSKLVNVRLLPQSGNDKGHCLKIKQSNLVCSETNNNSETDKVSFCSINNHSLLNDTLKNISPENSPKPRLIRSNSYTLESPSPILLAHLEKNSKKGEQKNLDEFKQLSTSRNWSSLENNYVPFENSEFSSINTVYNNEEGSVTKNDVTSSTPADLKRNISPTIEVIQTDISVQQITVNTNDVADEMNKHHLQEGNNFKNICDISNLNSQLMQVLKNIPEKYSKQIIELIEKQRIEQQTKVHDLEKVKKTFLDNYAVRNQPNNQKHKNRKTVEEEMESSNILEENVNKNIYHRSSESDVSNGNIHLQTESEQNSMHQSTSFSDSEKLHSSIISISPSQSIQYSITPFDTFRPPSSPSIKLIDLEYHDGKTDNGNHMSSEKSKDVLDLYVHEEKNMYVSRELFPQINAETIWTIKQEWAASVIGAHVKGYLTRRLLKTDKVQTLINTIKDALICALQLHNTENIEESDVELHRRLINQVSAACYAFHEIFFGLSVQEQMSVISTDRQRKIEKAKRPASAPGARRSKSSSRSSSKQILQPHSQSLTKV